MKKLKVGFLIDSKHVSYYVADLINFVNKNDLFESPTLITGYRPEGEKSFLKKPKTC